MTAYTYRPLETLQTPPRNASIDAVWEYARKLELAVHELNSKVEFLAESLSITIPSSRG